MNVTELPPRSNLETELAYFDQHREELLGRARGKFALIKGTRLIDTFESQADAIRRGYQEFGNAGFLVKQIVDVEVPLNFTSHNLGL